MYRFLPAAGCAECGRKLQTRPAGSGLLALNKNVRRTIGLMLLLGVHAFAFGQNAVLLKNPGFEEDFVTRPTGKATDKGQALGEVAQGWQDESTWAGVTVTYARHEAQPHSGRFAQEINVTRVDNGSAQFAQKIPFKKGVGLRATVWLRGVPGQSVAVMFRNGGPSWKTIAKKNVNLTAEWQAVRVIGVPSEDYSGSLMLQTSQPAHFYVDDVQLELMTQIKDDAPAKPGNLISGGSFETAALPYGWSFRAGGYEHLDLTWEDRPLQFAASGAVGRRSLQYEVPPKTSLNVFSPVFTFNGNRPHTASVWLKASRPDTPARLSWQGADLSQDVVVGTEWARYTMTRTLPYLDALRLAVNFPNRGEQPLTVWLDGAAVEESAQASAVWQDAAPHAVSLTLDRPGHILHDDEKALARLSIAPAPPAGATLALKVENLLGGVTSLPALALPAEGVDLPFFTDRPRGYFKLHATVLDAQGQPLSKPVELIYTRLPKPRDITPQESYFGVHIPLNPYYIALARASGHRWIRMHDTCMIGKWPLAEPQPGKWNFYDKQIDAAHDAGLAILGMLDGAPARVSKTPRNEGGYWSVWNIPNAPGAEEAWRVYVQTVVGHYQGKIDHWEVWNEPWGKWWLTSGGTPELYARLLKSAFVEAKKANPKALILGIDTLMGRPWTEDALKAAGTGHYDLFSFHDYDDGFVGGPDNRSKNQAAYFAAAQNAVGSAKPLWNTEGASGADFGSWYAPETGGVPSRTQASLYTRYDVTQLANGIQTFFLYSIQEGTAMGATNYRATEYDRAIKPAVAARAVLASLVDGAGIPLRSEPEPGVDVYTFPALDGKQVKVWWSFDGKSHTLPLPDQAQVLDVFGSPVDAKSQTVTVTAEPCYVILPAK
jgi:hypothetical protein